MGSIDRKQEWMDNMREGGRWGRWQRGGERYFTFFQFPPGNEIRQQAKNAKIELELSVIEEDMGVKEVGLFCST